MDHLERAFWEFHQDNPQVYEELLRLSLGLLDRGHSQYGIGALFEVIRFHRAMQTTDPSFKLNNNHRALYSRYLMHQEPRLRGFFQLRVRPASRAIEEAEEEEFC